jgi:hypothetical protein
MTTPQGISIFPFSPLVHILAFGLIAWIYITAKKIDSAREFGGTILALTSGMVLWVVICTALAVQDFFFQNNALFLPTMIFSIFAVAVLPVTYKFSKNLKGLIDLFIDSVPPKHIVSVHIVRLVALGPVYKMFMGLLPAHFIVPSGIPDFTLGLTAIYVSRNVDKLSNRFLITWNIFGMLVFVIALVTMQFSLMGPFQIFTEGPTAREVISFPMSLAPTFTGPVFIGLHFVSIAQILKRNN